AALGSASGVDSGVQRVLRHPEALARGEPRASRRPPCHVGEPERPRGRITRTRVFDTKELAMRFIPTRFHAPLDYIVGAVLIAAPWIFQFSDSGAATAVSIVLGIGLIAYSLFTNYELGVWKVAPMAVHNLIDIVAGAVLALSPWLFGFADEGANFWVPFVVIGVAAI